jgi:hypothetical protein
MGNQSPVTAAAAARLLLGLVTGAEAASQSPLLRVAAHALTPLPAGYGLLHIARHLMKCHFNPEMSVQNPSDDVAGSIWQALAAGRPCWPQPPPRTRW